jgi:hypothetical protein
MADRTCQYCNGLMHKQGLEVAEYNPTHITVYYECPWCGADLTDDSDRGEPPLPLGIERVS